MSLKLKSVLLILLSALLILSACSARTSTNKSNDISKAVNANDKQTASDEKPKMGGEIKVALGAAPPTLDLMFNSSTASRLIGMHIYESLVTWDYNYKLMPQLASSWDVSPDNKTYTFHLRKGVLFHNGKEMTADDVLASFERFKRISPRKQVLDPVADMKVVDPSTFQVNLKTPSPTFLEDIATPLPPIVIMPKELANIDGGKLANNQIIGTGPYQLEDFVPDQYIKLKKFDKYVADTVHPASGFGGDRVAYLDRITFQIVPEKASRLNGLQAGEYDYAESIEPTAYDQIANSKTLKPVILSPYFKIWALVNTLKAPLNNPDLRQAILAALDENSIMLAASGNKALYKLDSSIFYPEQYWYSDAGKNLYNQNNIEKAKALVKKSGYHGEEIKLVTNKDYDFMYQASVALQGQLEKIGLNVKMEVVDWPTANKMMTTPSEWNQFDITYTGISVRFDPTAYNMNFNSAYQFQPYKSDEMDNLLKQGSSTADKATRKEAYDKVQELIYKDVPILQHGDVYTLNASSTKLKGEKPWYMMRFWNVWKDQ